MDIKKILLPAFVGLAGLVYGQDNKSAGCFATLKAAYKKEQAFVQGNISEKMCWRMNYTTQYEMADPVNNRRRVVFAKGEMLANKNLRYVKNNDSTEVYMDKDDIFTVDNRTRSIMQTATPYNALNMPVNSVLDYIDAPLFVKSVKITCGQVVDSGGEFIDRYEITPIEKSKSQYLKVIYFVHHKTQEFRKVYTEFNPAFSSQFKNFTIVITRREARPLEPGWLPVKNKFLAANGKLTNKYNDYSYKRLKK